MNPSNLVSLVPVLLALWMPLAVPGLGQSVEPVEVVNFPDLQRVEGLVEISSPTPHSRLVARRDVLVSPGSLAAPGDAVALGSIDAAGFTDVVVSVHGLSTDRLSSPGELLVTLVPDEAPFVKAFEEDGLRLLAIETRAQLSTAAQSAHFVADQVKAQLGFPRYRVYAHNTSERSVTIDFYAYLVH